MSAHRYWRLQIDAVQSAGYTSVMELQLRTSIGGSNVATGGTASASSTDFGWVASNAFNGTTAGDGWHSGANGFPATTEWLQYDFGAGNDKDIVEFHIAARTSFTTQNPKDFRLQYSDNGTDWTTSITVISCTTWAANSYAMAFSANSGFGADGNPHRYWRLFVSVGANVTEIAEMEYRTSIGGSDVTGSGSASVNSSGGGTSAADAFDNDGVTRWQSPISGSCWLKYDFGAGNEKNVAEVAFVASARPSFAPSHFQIQYSDDDATWAVWLPVSGATWFPGERKVFRASGPVSDSSIPSAARYWRLLVEAITSGAFEVVEAELRLTSGGADATSAVGGYSGTGTAAGGEGDKLFDNNTATSWRGAVSDTTPFSWAGYDFGSGNDKDIQEIGIRGGATTAQSPSTFRVQRSDDGVRWANNITITGLSAWSANQTRYFDSTGEVSGAAPSSTARPVVFVCT
jgi:hypothetical protein